MTRAGGRSSSDVPSRLSRAAVAAAAAVVSLAACAPTRPATAPTPTSADTLAGRRFYAGRSWGTEAQFNPLSAIANEGFDILRAYPQYRRVFEWPYARAATNVARTLGSPVRTYNAYGWKRALRNELLPLSTPASGGGQWLPNYEFHLLGSGMVSARMTEWYARHGVPHPAVASAVTMMGAHVLNEIMENAGTTEYDGDSLTDLYVFDVAGILLFRSERVQRFFSGPRLQLTNWPLQPTLLLPERTLQNAGQQFVLRWTLPRQNDWRLLYTFGVSNQLGLSHAVGRRHTLSVAAGADATKIETLDEATGRKGIGLAPSLGVYVDRDGSLLASLQGAAGGDALATLNVYPGVVSLGPVSPGLWAQVARGGIIRFGLTPLLGLGVGRHARTR